MIMKKIKNSIIVLLCLVTTIVVGQPKGDVVIKGGTVLTVTNGTLENTDVYIKDGKIQRIAENIKAPSGVKVIDASGLYVMPGIIDAHSHLGISTVNEATSPITADVWTGDVINPYSVGMYWALAGGVTSIHAMHGSANVIGGQNETMKLRWGQTDPEAFRMQGAPRTIKFALGENPTRVHGRGNGVNPSTRMGVEFVIRDGFNKAIEYKKAWAEYEASKKKNPRAVPPKYNLRLQTLVDILDGKILIHCHSYRADEILMLTRVAKDFGIKNLTFQHANEAFKVAPELAEFGAGASVFADWWAYKFEVYYSTAYNATILTRNGVRTSINSDSGELIRHLYHEAAKTQRYGDLSDDEALALITINPALQLGVGDRIGSIEKGKDGDIAIFKNHPLSVYTVPQYTLVDGVVYFDINNDPDDMRVNINPEESIEPVILDENHERCMQDTEWIFNNK